MAPGEVVFNQKVWTPNLSRTGMLPVGGIPGSHRSTGKSRTGGLCGAGGRPSGGETYVPSTYVEQILVWLSGLKNRFPRKSTHLFIHSTTVYEGSAVCLEL